MALKKSVTVEEFAKLSKETQALYKTEPVEGAHLLDLEGEEDNGALMRAKQHEKDARKKAEDRAKLAEDKLAEIEATAVTEREKLARASGDIKALEKSWAEKHAAEQKKLQDQLSAKDAALTDLTVGNVAQAMAAEISVAPDVILPHISKRLRAEIVDGKAVTKVVDAQGQPSALTVDELKQEFLANKSFAPIITASKASGGGAGGGGGGGGAGSGKIDFSKSPKQIAADMKSSGKVKGP